MPMTNLSVKDHDQNTSFQRHFVKSIRYFLKSIFDTILCIGAVGEIVDSLDDIEILEESDRLLRTEVLNAVDDHRLRAILEVSFFYLNYNYMKKFFARKYHIMLIEKLKE